MPPNLTGYYRFVSQENMDNYLRALGNATHLIPLLSLPLLSSASKAKKVTSHGRGLRNLWAFCL